MIHNKKGEILAEIKKTDKYAGISEKIITEEISEFFKKNPLSESRPLTRPLIKNIKKQLHLKYSSFQTKKKRNTENYLSELKEKLDTNQNIGDTTDKLLSITLSTKERLDSYHDLYTEIFRATSAPEIIVDLGAGFNVFSYPFMNLKKLVYYSYDIDDRDISLLESYYQIMAKTGLKGSASILDIHNKEDIRKIPQSDIIFLFKVIDLIDRGSHKPSEELISFLLEEKKTKYIVASFATKTLTRKPMNFPKRNWFKIMLERKNFRYKIINTKNEDFYLINLPSQK